jgi:hypothetical protein
MGEFSWNDGNGAALNLSGTRFGISSGSVSASYVNVDMWYPPRTNTGDHEYNVYLADFTPYVTDQKFSINATAATSGVYQIAATFATTVASTVTNVSAKLYFTYEYEDSLATTLVKTVRIPIQSHHTSLTTANTSYVIGTTGSLVVPKAQIPALNTFLPETVGRTIQQAWIETYSNNASAAVTNGSASYQIDVSASSIPRGFQSGTLNTAVMVKDIWIYNTASYDISVPHSFSVASSVAARMETMGGFMGVTYTYTAASASNPRRLNSIILGTDARNKSFYINGITDQDFDWDKTEFLVPETNPSLTQSAVAFHVTAPAGGVLGVYAGNQGKQTPQLSRSYTFLAAQVSSGGDMVFHRIDHSGGLSLSQGSNVLTSSYQFNTAVGCGLWGSWAYINYYSDCSPQGEGAHNHTTLWCLLSTSIAAGTNQTDLGLSTQRNVTIPESMYYLNSVTYEQIGRTSVNVSSMIQAQITSSEYINKGWISIIPQNTNVTDLELGMTRQMNDALYAFNRYPEVTGTFMGKKLNIEQPRKYRITADQAENLSLRQWVTYHSMTSSIEGTVTGSARWCFGC